MIPYSHCLLLTAYCEVGGDLTRSGPNPAEQAEQDDVADLEWRVLRALCAEGRQKERRELARRSLAGYCWQEPVHRSIFEVVISFPAASSQALRDQLPSLLTRRGFPDYDFETLFESLGVTWREFQQLVRKLTDR